MAKVPCTEVLNFVSIARQAGSTGDEAIRFDGEFLYVDDVEQAPLEAALLAYDPLADERDRSASRIAARRYMAEVGGISVNSMRINTDDRSKLLINGAAVEAMLDPGYVLRWKAEDGFVDLTAQQVIAVARAVRAHVQACFDREAALLAELAAGTFTEDLLEEGWPNG
ncbi:DUF4376 domain-containing protein [Pseudomonas sp. BN515]|uniref:DUF4376 domain-containing protein n=1 Tax=Pseudomonas sp. BN515 TaxID=2567892 RepID=UPI00245461AF|nr:DUF4376 domain-containing protein [Pseudomonas sp. BN515]